MLAEQLISPEIQTLPYQIIDLETQPEACFIHSYYLQEAKEILFSNHQKAENDDPQIANSTPLPINVLSVSDRIVLEENGAVNNFSLREALFLDSLRLVAEVRNKLSPRYFSSNFQYYDPEKKDLFSNSRSLTEISENGLSSFCEPEEQQIRVLDYVDNMMNIELVEKCRQDNSNITLLRVKECPDYVIDKYQKSKDENDTYNGYVPQIKKFVLQRDRISSEGVISDHFALPGTLIDTEVISEALNKLSGQDSYQELSALELRAKSFVISSDEESFIEFVKLLDDLASKKHNQNIFMGEVVPEESDKDYSQFINRCQEQDQENIALANNVSDFLLSESRQKNDPIISEVRLNKYLSKKTFELFKHDTIQIARIFGVQVATNLEAINHQFQTTKNKATFDGAMKVLADSLPPVLFCGAGSCGLIGIASGSNLDKTLSKLGLKGEKLGDTIRKCPNCGKKTVYYDAFANKACTHCGITEIKK